eukprot:9719942-Alexandrium_andersonii.AAC.1
MSTLLAIGQAARVGSTTDSTNPVLSGRASRATQKAQQRRRATALGILGKAACSNLLVCGVRQCEA